MFNRKRRLIKVEDIEVTKEKLDELNELTLGGDSARYVTMMRKVFGGYCCVCNAIPNKKAYFSYGKDAKLIEHYCLKCFPKINDDLKTNGLNEKIVIEYR
jgi:hypothetical protein